MLKGSGVKEIVGWEDKHNENDVTVASKLASSPRTCELLKEATINWDMAKNIGVNCCNQEGSLVCKMMSMEEGKSFLFFIFICTNDIWRGMDF